MNFTRDKAPYGDVKLAQAVVCMPVIGAEHLREEKEPSPASLLSKNSFS